MTPEETKRVLDKLDKIDDKVSNLAIKDAGNAPRINELEKKTDKQQTEINSVYKLVREVRTAGLVIGAMITVGTPVISAFLLKWIG